MKILYLEHPEVDYGSNQLSMGLRQILGDNNVVDFPYKYCIHGQEEKLQNTEIREFIKDNPTVFPSVNIDSFVWITGPFIWAIPSAGREYRYEEIKSMIKNGEFDFIIMTPRAVCIYYLRRLIRDLNHNIPPVILCDFEDYTDIKFDILTMFNPHIKIITKSSYDPDYLRNSLRAVKEETKKDIKVYPLPLSSPLIGNQKFQFDDSNENKTIDVSARLGLTRELRKDVVDSLNDMRNMNMTIVTSLNTHVHYDIYLKELASSKISVSMYGYSLIGPANRTWEIPSYNTLLLTEKMNVYYEHPFEDGKTCIFFDPYVKDDICNKVLYWLSDEMENERRKIAKAGHEHLKNFHTCKARAQRLLDIVKIEFGT